MKIEKQMAKSVALHLITNPKDAKKCIKKKQRHIRIEKLILEELDEFIEYRKRRKLNKKNRKLEKEFIKTFLNIKYNLQFLRIEDMKLVKEIIFHLAGKNNPCNMNFNTDKLILTR